MAWLRLIRWQNLLIIFFTQFVAWRCVVLPPGIVNNEVFTLTALNFLLLSFSTILIAAAGYVINDYFDVQIDEVNRPGRVVLGKIIPRRSAIVWHAVLNFSGVALAALLAFQARHYEWLLLQLGCTALLWFYSTHFKRQFVTGNLVVALLAALTVFTLVVYEPLMHGFYKPLLYGNRVNGSSLSAWVLISYAYFAFMLTWIREITKDMEDLPGDKADGCDTMPVRRGLQFSTRFIMALVLLVILPLAAASWYLFKSHFTILSVYILALLIVPLIVWTAFVRMDFTPAHYHKASRGLKIIMILGVCSLLIYQLQLSLNIAY